MSEPTNAYGFNITSKFESYVMIMTPNRKIGIKQNTCEIIDHKRTNDCEAKKTKQSSQTWINYMIPPSICLLRICYGISWWVRHIRPTIFIDKTNFVSFIAEKQNDRHLHSNICNEPWNRMNVDSSHGRNEWFTCDRYGPWMIIINFVDKLSILILTIQRLFCCFYFLLYRFALLSTRSWQNWRCYIDNRSL